MREVAELFANLRASSRVVDQFRRRTDLRWQFPSRSLPTRIAQETASNFGSFRTFASFAPLRETKKVIHHETLSGDLLEKGSRIPQSWMGKMHRLLGTELSSRKGAKAQRRMAMREVVDPFAHRKQKIRIVDQFRRKTNLRWQFPSQSLPARIAQETASRFGSFRTFASFAPLRETKKVIHHQTPPGNLIRRR